MAEERIHMPSTPRKHPNLISYATGTALDILFNKGGTVGVNFKSAPSSNLIRERWSKLSADLAISLAEVITDQILLDEIVAKEKRKTVLEALNRNKNLNSVTRLYLFQKSLSAESSIRTRDVYVNFPLLEKLEMAKNDSSLHRFINTYQLADEILRLDGDEIEKAFKLAYEIDQDVLNGLLKNNGSLAIILAEKCGISLRNHRLTTTPSLDTPNELIRFLVNNAADKRSYATRIARNYRDDLKTLLEIDDALIDLNSDYMLSIENIKILQQYGRINNIIEKIHNKYRLDDDAAEYLITNGIDELTKCLLAFRLSDPKRSAELLTYGNDLATGFQAAAQILERENRRWLRETAPFLSENQIVQALTLVPNLIELDYDTIQNFSDILKIEPADFVIKLPKEVFVKITSLPENTDCEKILSYTSGDQDLYDRAINLVLRYKDIPDNVKSQVADYILRSDDQQRIQNWLVKADLDTITQMLTKHRNSITRNVLKIRPHNLAEGLLHLVISDLKPSTNWGSVTQNDVLNAVMSRLNHLVGDDHHLWETVLGLYPTWSGSIDELVQASKNL